jgi:hypothetical protein
VRWVRGLGDPWTRSIVLAVGLVVGGIVALGITAVALSDAVSVPEQVAFLVSGGFGGLAVTATGVALFDVQRSRRAAAEERHHFAVLAAELGVVAEGIAARRMASPSSGPAGARRRGRRVLRAR